MVRKTPRSKGKQSGKRRPRKPVSPSIAEARRLIRVIERSQVPFGESATLFNRIKSQVDGGKELDTEDYEHLLGLVKKARDWEKAVESSAQTRPEETLSG